MRPEQFQQQLLQLQPLFVMTLALMAAQEAGSRAPPLQQHDSIVRDPVKYERGDCLYETVVCLRDDSCGPLLRLVYAYCYETPGYQQARPDGSRLACDSSCAALLSVLFNTSSGVRLRECNYSNHQFWSDLVVHKQLQCAPLLAQTDRMLRRTLDGTARTECWLAGLLCVREFACRSTFMSILDLPCYDGPCSPDCAGRLANFGSMFNDVFHTFLSCLCGQDLADACPTPLPSGYLSNRSSALDNVAFAAPLDRLIEQLGREAIKEQMNDGIWLLKVFEHRSYCRSLKAIIGKPDCVPNVRQQPAAADPLCALESVHHWPTTKAPSTLASTSGAGTTNGPPVTSSSQSDQMAQTQWQLEQPTPAHPMESGDDATAAVTGAQQQQLARTWPTSLLLLACCALAQLVTQFEAALTH